MEKENFNYKLPVGLIAQEPNNPRDHSRMMILDRLNGAIFHSNFFDLPKILDEKYVLVFNNTQVMPARVFGYKETGGKVEVLFVKKLTQKVWEVLIKGKITIGTKITLSRQIQLQVINFKDQIFRIKILKGDCILREFLRKKGQMPLPPYIKSQMKENEARKKYQSIFAKIDGSVAAPTASLHFTPRILNRLKNKKIKFAFLTLEVGWGTFAPVKSKKIEDHKIHNEKMVITQKTADFLNQKKKEGKKILAIGTTVARALETATDGKGILHEHNKETSIYIYPPYKFKFVDAMLTNFHLPKSSLLFLVSAFAKTSADKSAFAGRDKIFKAYREAVKKKYRFFSFGDCMLIK
ncbi:MAG: tRNA preQ1(34) S-adenosylmethionine ribosyltransferase-isomerase QueA [Patescibacteria group bacterium]|nr:tRNA preQ1(34) S-adenosylmethionine ribosyltransferase-isomerase QueA [Patescibacteria group bacterium]